MAGRGPQEGTARGSGRAYRSAARGRSVARLCVSLSRHLGKGIVTTGRSGAVYGLPCGQEGTPRCDTPDLTDRGSRPIVESCRYVKP
jgi:hypothetical protein